MYSSNLGLDTAFLILSPGAGWLKDADLEGSLDYGRPDFPGAGDVIGGDYCSR